MTSSKIMMLKLSDGERYPILLSHNDSPHEIATLFITTQYRNSSKAPNTCMAALSAVRIFLIWASKNNIDYEDRFLAKNFLTNREIESLCVEASNRICESEDLDIKRLADNKARFDGKARKKISAVSSGVRYTRITYISIFIRWVVRYLHEQDGNYLTNEIRINLKDMHQVFKIQRGRGGQRSQIRSPKGLEFPAVEKLKKFIDRTSENTIFSESVILRNRIIIDLFLTLGIRMGELAALKISDFDFQSNVVTIARRHDDSEDPRNNQPVVKTLDRILPISEIQSERILNYIINVRGKVLRAKKSPFLFVVHKNGPYIGTPISMKGIDKVFMALRASDPQLFESIRAHRLRHTRNEAFAADMAANKIPHPTQEKLLEYTNGWKAGSGTASTYTRGYIQALARSAMQELAPSKK